DDFVDESRRVPSREQTKEIHALSLWQLKRGFMEDQNGQRLYKWKAGVSSIEKGALRIGRRFLNVNQ
ncbi:unnamed protein product, partial [Durusdinium trenchii]